MGNTSLVLDEYARIISSNDGRLEKLLKYADKILRWRKISDRAITAEDVVTEVITKIASGARAWDTEKEPDLFAFLFMVIKSYILNLETEEKRSLKPNFSQMFQAAEDGRFLHFVESHNLSKIEDLSKLIEQRDIISSCLNELKDDIEGALIVIDLSEGLMQKDIAEDLGIPAEKVRAIMERVKRKLQKLVKEYKNTEGNEKNCYPGVS